MSQLNFTSGVAKNDVWWMLCPKAVALKNKRRIAGRQRPEHSRQGGLSASVFTVDRPAFVLDRTTLQLS